MERTSNVDRYLLVRSRRALCAIPLSEVIETMRPLPLVRVADMPPAILGLSVIRGAPCLVVDLEPLLEGTAAEAGGRWVTLRLGDRRAALSVRSVEGIRRFSAETLARLPGALGDGGARALSALGTVDDEFLMVLASTRIVPEDVWQKLDRERGQVEA